ncbi:MAG TPA: hypothetical protein VLH79_02650 [Chthonomonadales bacterium]|nr:hypothetical protein [Chthonomonadales bacterium]
MRRVAGPVSPIIAAAILIASAPYLLAAARQAPAPGLVVNVDMQQLIAASDARAQADQRLRAYHVQMFERFDRTSRLIYATPEELEQFSEAINADPETDATRQAAAKIEADVQGRREELQRLSAISDSELTDADRARIRALNAMPPQAQHAFSLLRRLYDQRVQRREAVEARRAAAEVRTIVGQIARDRGFSQVFDSTSLVYATVDMTPIALPRVRRTP